LTISVTPPVEKGENGKKRTKKGEEMGGIACAKIFSRGRKEGFPVTGRKKKKKRGGFLRLMKGKRTRRFGDEGKRRRGSPGREPGYSFLCRRKRNQAPW